LVFLIFFCAFCFGERCDFQADLFEFRVPFWFRFEPFWGLPLLVWRLRLLSVTLVEAEMLLPEKVGFVWAGNIFTLLSQ